MRLLNRSHYPLVSVWSRGLVMLGLLTVTALAFSGWRPTPLLLGLGLELELEGAAGAAGVSEKNAERRSAEDTDPLRITPVFPDFTAYDNVEDRKQAFFDFMHTYVQQENRRVLALREQLVPLYEVARDGAPLSRVERDTLHRIAREYRLDPEAMGERELAAELMLRVDKLPTSLVLAQAANESAWGTSRFARQANNLFGQWCFDEGCGVIPENRPPDANHEVRAFADVGEAVRAYFHNLNTNTTYDYLRRLRSDMRRRDEPLNSLVLVYGLTDYSARGVAYVTELQSIIKYNGLHRLDQASVNQS